QVRAVARRDGQIEADFVAKVAGQVGFPAFVKPANMGSSVGVSKAVDEASLAEALELALRYDEWVLVEEGVTAREVECAVLGSLDPRATILGEIIPKADWYDYEDKYSGAGAELVIPADLPQKVHAEAARIAVDAFVALRCEGLARVDFFYEDATGQVFLNEVNTIPGFTPISMYPKMWAASGLDYPALIDELVRLALERHAHRTRLSTKR
ncbi:MAG: ATP-grasp domain-containing protein, partial [Actinomycetota bacterium]